jgi:HK97 family phage major capsid protein
VGCRAAIEGTESTYLWDLDNSINGYRAAVSNNVPSNLTFGTSTTVCHGAIFGNWAELLIGEWSGAMEVLVDPYTVASQNMIQTHVFVLVDIAVRHPASFTIAKGLKIA